MKKSITILSFIFSFFLFVSNAEASFPVKKNKKSDTEIATKSKDTTNSSDGTYMMSSGKSQIAALLLCWFVGIIGIHRFYLGYTWQGIVQILTLGGLGIWTLIDFIRIITGDLQPKNGSYTQTF
ncbi:TM2 domain-containing protein [Tenacibaculum ascidiaceicola]|uniref:TM2 domain-containing protein n=1 Tax=Tenacibaculum ascidiaceicola TaxID=1699411 RepID=UPI0039E92E2C